LTGDKPAHICNLISGFCVYIIISSVAIKDKNKPTPKTWAGTIIERFTLCENDTPQIERYPSVRTICLGRADRETLKKQRSRYGNCSTAADFIGDDARKPLKSRGFGQKRIAWQFSQNYHAIMAERKGFGPGE
jgi:hypothetical protein